MTPEHETTDASTPRHDDELDELPSFGLSYAFDDRRWPSEMTVFEHGPNISTSWLTIDVEHAVPLGEVA